MPPRMGLLWCGWLEARRNLVGLHKDKGRAWLVSRNLQRDREKEGPESQE